MALATALVRPLSALTTMFALVFSTILHVGGRVLHTSAMVLNNETTGYQCSTMKLSYTQGYRPVSVRVSLQHVANRVHGIRHTVWLVHGPCQSATFRFSLGGMLVRGLAEVCDQAL